MESEEEHGIMRKPPALIAFVSFLALAWCVASLPAGAQENFPAPEPMQQWLKDTANQGTIPPGTSINMQNWRQYKQFMPYGMQMLFAGKYFWKMPADVSMAVGPTVVLPLPKGYVEASEKYGAQTSVGTTASGHHFVQGYVAGEPFPNPQEPDKGYKLLADVWFS
ncbi:MAG: DUF1329 domain-containing protein, partial [Bryobacteraceae bacterium]